MNKRQAKIEALRLAYKTLLAIDGVPEDLSEEDGIKVMVEFKKITDNLHRRVLALVEKPVKGMDADV